MALIQPQVKYRDENSLLLVTPDNAVVNSVTIIVRYLQKNVKRFIKTILRNKFLDAT
jgi:hypothetical protein